MNILYTLCDTIDPKLLVIISDPNVSLLMIQIARVIHCE